MSCLFDIELIEILMFVIIFVNLMCCFYAIKSLLHLVYLNTLYEYIFHVFDNSYSWISDLRKNNFHLGSVI